MNQSCQGTASLEGHHSQRHTTQGRLLPRENFLQHWSGTLKRLITLRGPTSATLDFAQGERFPTAGRGRVGRAPAPHVAGRNDVPNLCATGAGRLGPSLRDAVIPHFHSMKPIKWG